MCQYCELETVQTHPKQYLNFLEQLGSFYCPICYEIKQIGDMITN